jgi:hypothetical protein
MNIGKTYFDLQRAKWDCERGLDVAAEIARKVEPMLPDGWESRFCPAWGVFGGLLFCPKDSFGKETPPEEFSLVCKLIGKVTGKDVKKKPWTEGDQLICLQGEVYVPISWWGRSGVLQIQARVFKPKDCKLEYETKTVTVCKVPAGCMGVAGLSMGETL